MSARLDWATDGADWPLREASAFVEAAGLRWHVQRLGRPADAAPTLLLLHGTGASTHSWRDLAPRLAQDFHLVAPDLPGHAFTGPAGGAQSSLPGMARAVEGLMATLDLRPAVIVGHSAGAAVAVKMALDGAAGRGTPAAMPRLIVSLNGALLPLGGLAGQVFSPVARLLAAVPGVPELFSWRAADPAMLQRLIDATGSRIDERGRALYRRLVASSGHAAGALAMMARWDLHAFADELPRLNLPPLKERLHLHLVAGDNDLTVPPRHAYSLHRLVPAASVTMLPGLGHLAHEERPDDVAAIVLEQARRWAILPGSGH